MVSPAVKQITELIEELPPQAQTEVRDFAEFLLLKYGRRSAKKLRQDWAGALRDYREQYTSLELEKKALE